LGEIVEARVYGAWDFVLLAFLAGFLANSIASLAHYMHRLELNELEAKEA
jgi:hypothetical protein